MVILGLDPGVARLGYGVLASDGRRETCTAYGVLETPAGDDLAIRLRALHDALTNLIDLHRPDRICVGRLYFSKNVKTATMVGHARGVILLTCAQRDCVILEVSPQDVKQSVAGYGAAEKRQVQKMVQALLRLPEPPRPDDAADALAIALCGSRIAVAS